MPRSILRVVLLAGLGALAVAGCGREDVNLDGDVGGGADARFGGSCQEGASQCNNCLDDDGDGAVDGFDPECTGPLDRDEGSFATGIPGDNVDEKKQDCFFDGNSGADFGQQISTCCLLPDGECPASSGGGGDGVGAFDRATDCAYSQDAIDYCAPLTPPGCDCFGCCTVCVEAGCFDILANPAVSPDCSQETAGTAACPVCQKVAACDGGACNADPDDCVLCPGESPTDLPGTCNGANACPGGAQTACPSGTECDSASYCQAGCCVAAIP
jgi:hypothetical protein